MKAIILAGGKGTRLRPITDYMPKSMIPINNIPIIDWQMQYLKKFGINEVFVCIGYKSEIIENYLKIKNNFGIKITLIIENSPLGTGGAIKKAGSEIKDKSFIVLNGDTITNIDLKKLFKIKNSIATIELRTKYGTVETTDTKITTFNEKKPISKIWMNAGIYHLERSILSELPKKGDIEKTLFPEYAKKQKLNTVKFKNVIWHSIDSFKDIEECAGIINKIIK